LFFLFHCFVPPGKFLVFTSDAPRFYVKKKQNTDSGSEAGLSGATPYFKSCFAIPMLFTAEKQLP